MEACPGEPSSEVIVDDAMLAADDPHELILCCTCCLDVLRHCRVTAKLRKCRFMQQKAEFVGFDLLPEGNAPARSKENAFHQLTAPETIADLRHFISFVGFYQEHLPNCEIEIGPYRKLLKGVPGPTQLTDEENRALIKDRWTKEHEDTFHMLKKQILSFPACAQPDDSKRFCLRTDWAARGRGAVLAQPGDSPEAMKAMADEIKGGQCEFDKSNDPNLRLRPTPFMSKRNTTNAKRTLHSTMGEAGTGAWAMKKFKHFPHGREFTWLADCKNAMDNFFEIDELPTHQAQRWKMFMLQFCFAMWHRSARWMLDCDFVTRHNNRMCEWKKETNATKPNDKTAEANNNRTMMAICTRQKLQMAVTFTPIVLQGEPGQDHAHFAALVASARTVWTINWFSNVETIAFEAGIELQRTQSMTPHDDTRDVDKLIQQLARGATTADWLMIALPTHIKHSWIDAILRLVQQAGTALQATTVTSNAETTTNQHWMWDKLTHSQELSKWAHRTATISNTKHAGGPIEACTRMHTWHRNPLALRGIEKPTTPMNNEILADVSEAANNSTQDNRTEEFTAFQHGPHQDRAKIAACANTEGRRIPACDMEWPAPKLSDATPTNSKGTHCAILTEDPTEGSTWRCLEQHELLQMCGMHPDNEEIIDKLHATFGGGNALRWQAPKHTTEWMMQKTTCGEAGEGDELPNPDWNGNPDEPTWNNKGQGTTLLGTLNLNQWATYPLPTTATWQTATLNDPDTAETLRRLQNPDDTTKRKLTSDTWVKEPRGDRLEAEQGILCRHEAARRANIRQLRTRAVPRDLVPTTLAACHTSPMTGHMDVNKTFCRTATRFWWPKMLRDIKDCITRCLHCRLTNITNHEQQTILRTMEAEVPFDIIASDVWTPGTAATKFGEAKMLTCLEFLTAFTNAALIKDGTADTVIKQTLLQFALPNGMPKLIAFDAGSEFAGVFTEACTQLDIPCHPASKENHKAILNERFHRFLNKTEKLHIAECESIDQHMLGAFFAFCAWNAAPVDGTNIPRSVAAKGRDFPLPTDMGNTEEMRRRADNSTEETNAAETMQHVKSFFPMWRKQMQLFQTLNQERREHHRNKRNEARKARMFEPGDLVLVKRMVRSSKERNVAAKVTTSARGPHRIVERVHNTDSRKSQRSPFTKGKGKPGRITKESAARLEKLPPRASVHRKVNGPDLRIAQLEREFVTNPLEKCIGAHRTGTCQAAEPTQPHAFIPMEELWQEDVNEDDDGESDDKLFDETQEPPPQQPPPPPSPQPETRNRRSTRNARPPQWLTEGMATSQATQQITKLCQKTRQSKDKAFFIFTGKATTPEWTTGTTDLMSSDTNKAKQDGECRVRLWRPNTTQAKRRKRKNCSFCPWVITVANDKTIEATPQNVKRTLTQQKGEAQWKTTTVNACRDGICGPMEFETNHTIAPRHWTAFKDTAQNRRTNTRPMEEQEEWTH